MSKNKKTGGLKGDVLPHNVYPLLKSSTNPLNNTNIDLMSNKETQTGGRGGGLPPSLEGRLSSLEANVTNIKDSLQETKQDIKNLDAKIEKKFDNLIEKIDANTREINVRLDNVNEKFIGINEKFTGVYTWIAGSLIIPFLAIAIPFGIHYQTH